MGRHKSKVAEAAQKLKDMGVSAKDLSNPTKLLDEVANTDSVKQMNAMAKGIEDGLMMIQEHVLIVQKNQKHFETYFKGMYDKIGELEKKINKLQSRIDKVDRITLKP